MKFVLCIHLFLCCALANVFTPEYYKNQIEVLRQFDIESNYISDLVFVESKNTIKRVHSKTLEISSSEFYEFIPAIRKIMKENDLPKEFLYLAIVESGLRTQSTSRTRATGIWQFMERTARNFDLRVDQYVDERRDPFKSTAAAASFLKDLKLEFGKWYLAILAYNCGSGRLKQAIKEANSDDLAVLLDNEKAYLPRETRAFIKKILTIAFMAKNEDFLFDENLALANYALSNEFVKVQIPSSVSLGDLAKLIDLSLMELKRYNPHFRYDFTPPDEQYYMYIPLEKRLVFEQNYDPKKLAKVEIKIPKTQIYIVKAGDSLWSIARKYGISVAQIKELNTIKKNHLSIKQKLIIPLKEEYKYAQKM